MTSAQYAQLVAYLKAMAAKNNGENTQTNQQVSGAASSGSKLSDMLWKYGPKAVKWGYNAYNQPAAAYAATAAPTAQAGTGTIGASGVAEGAGLAGGYGTASAGAGTGVTMAEAGGAAGGGSLGGMGATGMTAGGAASLIAPFVMAYLAYQAGSGVNEPLRRKYQTQGTGRMLSEMLAGNKIDPANTPNFYVPTKKLPSWMDPNSRGMAGDAWQPGMETIDPRGSSMAELYDSMHRMGSGRYQTGGTGNSGYSDQDIDAMFGDDKDKLAKGMGLERLPSWEGRRWDDGYEAGFDPMAVPVKKSEEGWNALDANSRRPYEDQARYQGLENNNSDLTSARELWQRQKDKEEVEKLLGYKLY